MAETEPHIHARGLTKRRELHRRRRHRLRRRLREAFGFLGPNGAGKTSTMRMIGCVSPVIEGTHRASRSRRSTRAWRMLRQLTTGAVDASIVVHLAYLATMGLVGLLVVWCRLDRLLLK